LVLVRRPGEHFQKAVGKLDQPIPMVGQNEVLFFAPRRALPVPSESPGSGSVGVTPRCRLTRPRRLPATGLAAAPDQTSRFVLLL
jgi:hypothetical protein